MRERTIVEAPDEQEPPLRTDCPFCGGRVIRVQYSNAQGVRAESLCCGVGLALIDGYDDVLAGLPEALQQAALSADRAEAEDWRRRSREAAEAFARYKEEYAKRYAHLMKVEGEVGFIPA